MILIRHRATAVRFRIFITLRLVSASIWVFSPSPEPYTGEWRCDLHPRFSPDGQFVVIDSAHMGNGRQMYRIEVGDIV